MIQEPIILNYYEENDDSVPDSIRALPKVILKINPANLTINWRKIITRVRTKSRIVSLYWGQEPINFSYIGQTGNLYPTNEIQIQASKTSTIQNVTITDLLTSSEELQARQQIVLNNIASASEESTISLFQTELEEIESELIDIQSSIDNIQSSISTIEDTSTHTEILEMSPKYQVWQNLQKLYEDSQDIADLLKVKYRDYIFEGYFENFGFTDDGTSPWERPYTVSFIILNWDRKFTIGDKQVG